MYQDLANKIKTEFERLTGISVSAAFMPKGLTHRPTTLQRGTCGVYAFVTEQHCLKVGKAGVRSPARWNSHHYNLDETTPSTLPKSMMKDLARVKTFFPEAMHAGIDAIDRTNVQAWMRENTSRIEFLIPEDTSKYALNLLEALAQYYLKPVYEGRPNA